MPAALRAIRYPSAAVSRPPPPHPPPRADLSADVQTRHDGRSSGYALVAYESVELAQNAILCCNGTDIGGRQVLCRFDRG